MLIALDFDALQISPCHRSVAIIECILRVSYRAGGCDTQNRARQDKKKVRASQCFRSFHTAERTIEGIEALHRMRKGQVKRLSGDDAVGQAKFVMSLFGVAV